MQVTLAGNENGNSCRGCEIELPVRLARVGEVAVLWKCSHCFRPTVGVCVPHLMEGYANRVLFGECYFDASELPGVPHQIWQEAFRLSGNIKSYSQNSSHRDCRVAWLAAVEAIQLTPEFEPVGGTMCLMGTNISRFGVGLLHSKQLEQPQIAIQFPPTGSYRIQVIAELVRQDKMENGLFVLGAKLTHRLGQQRESSSQRTT
jgi:hypothetical protein